MEAAEEEMEAAFRRAGDIQRVQVQRREYETQELRRLLAAKDRAIDNLRETISSTRRALEAKLAQAEAALAHRDTEVVFPGLRGLGGWESSRGNGRGR